MWDRVRTWWRATPFRPLSDEAFERERRRLLEKTPVPLFWLFGKTGSGKTSIIRYLTGAEHAQIGSGFRPQTRASAKFSFPTEEMPVLEFLDTRGLGEIGYDPDEEIREFDTSTHLMIVTVRAADHALEAVLGPLRKIRKARPTRPVVLALTCLHDLYPGQQHPSPDPLPDEGTSTPETPAQPGDDGAEPPREPAAVPEALRRSLALQQERFAGLVDRIVPIDLTRPEDGFDEPHFGGDRLKRALIDHLPDACRQTFLTVEEVMNSLQSLHERQAMPYIAGASLMAATAAAVPVPWIDIPAVTGIQSELVRRLAALYGQQFNVQHFLKIAGAVGGRLVLQQVMRGALKVIPGVGQAANAALAFAATYGLGEACCWYFGRRLAGHAPTAEELREVVQQQTEIAKDIWQKHHAAESGP